MHYHCSHCCVISTEQRECPACGNKELVPIKIEVHQNKKDVK